MNNILIAVIGLMAGFTIGYLMGYYRMLDSDKNKPIIPEEKSE